MAPKIAKIAKVFKNGRSQAVRIPKEFRFDVDEVTIERKGESLVLTPRKVPRYKNWKEYLEKAPRLSDDFPDDIPDSPPRPVPKL
ncbi:MAG TPA: type II toxin-antitoxin system VapB family antitoxin [Candidatus Binataceae bacterium]|nr:type II toxin-antitoxin system VapB family antitoxin [Candidatus Binataceae bacterium]